MVEKNHKDTKTQRLLFLFFVSLCLCGFSLPLNELSKSEKRMIRVFYRWKVKQHGVDSFVKAWSQATREIRANVKGARGSILLRDHDDPSKFLAIARWNSFEEWQAFRQVRPPDRAAAQAMLAAGELLSAEPLDEVGDRLDYSLWKGKMIRIYRIGVKQGREDDFQKAWLKASIAINAKMKGARGSLLMQDRKKQSTFVEVVRWDSLEDWKAFIAAEPADPEAFSTIFGAMDQISTEVMDEIENLLAE
jgi:heme-degrading monooxygenase HmoA